MNCTGSFFNRTACGECDRCEENLALIKKSTGLIDPRPYNKLVETTKKYVRIEASGNCDRCGAIQKKQFEMTELRKVLMDLGEL